MRIGPALRTSAHPRAGGPLLLRAVGRRPVRPPVPRRSPAN